jgi:H+-transporting ATP synthase F0 complex subunit s
VKFKIVFVFVNRQSYDKNRVNEVGADRACAEWLLKCGAQVRLKNWGNPLTDFNKIPPGSKDSFQVEEIFAENCKLMALGFEHLSMINII